MQSRRHHEALFLQYVLKVFCGNKNSAGSSAGRVLRDGTLRSSQCWKAREWRHSWSTLLFAKQAIEVFLSSTLAADL